MERSSYSLKALNDINVTPLVDVMMVILIIFILIAPIMEQGITIKLPDTSAKYMKSQDAVTVSVSKDKKIYLGNTLVSLPALEDRLKVLRSGIPDLPVILRADKNLPYETVVRVLDSINRSGILKLGLATKVESLK